MQTHWKEINVKLDKTHGQGICKPEGEMRKENAKCKKGNGKLQWDENDEPQPHKLTGKHCFDDTQGQPDGR